MVEMTIKELNEKLDEMGLKEYSVSVVVDGKRFDAVGSVPNDSTVGQVLRSVESTLDIKEDGIERDAKGVPIDPGKRFVTREEMELYVADVYRQFLNRNKE